MSRRSPKYAPKVPFAESDNGCFLSSLPFDYTFEENEAVAESFQLYDVDRSCGESIIAGYRELAKDASNYEILKSRKFIIRKKFCVIIILLLEYSIV